MALSWLKETAQGGLDRVIDNYTGAPTGYTHNRPTSTNYPTGAGVTGGGNSAPVDNTPGETQAKAAPQMVPGVDNRHLVLGGAALAVTLVIVLAVR